jgi:hypothetical protein
MAPVAIQTQSHLEQSMESKPSKETTPTPLVREALEETPEAPALLQPAKAAERPVPAPTGMESAEPPAPLKGLGKLPHFDFWQGGMPVRNTFINFAAGSPDARAATSQLCGETEPRNFKPEPFSLYDEDWRCASTPATPPDAQSLENPVVISLQNSLAAPSIPERSKETKRIQLNLAVWIPTVSRSKAAPVRVSEHHFPAPETSLTTSLSAREDSDSNGDPVCRRLFHAI